MGDLIRLRAGDAVPAWVVWLEEYAGAKLGSRGSSLVYQRELKRLWSFLGHDQPARVHAADLARWRAHVLASSLAPTTKRHRLVICSGFFRWLYVKGYISSNPADGMKLIRAESPEGNALSEAECEALLRAPDARTRWGRRDRAALELMALEALRVHEVCRLDVDDLGERYGKPALRVRGKGGSLAWVRLSGRTAADIRAWLEVRPGPVEKGGALFLCRPTLTTIRRPLGGTFPRLSPRAVAHAVRVCAQRALITIPISPHDLRRTAASIAHAHGATVDEIRRLLRHRSLSATTAYLSGLLAQPAVDLNPLGKGSSDD